LFAVTENVTESPTHFVVELGGALIVTAALTVTPSELDRALPQELVGVTVTLPPMDPQVTVIEVVFCPAVIVAPEGIVQA
jgi:hypothetical protein